MFHQVSLKFVEHSCAPWLEVEDVGDGKRLKPMQVIRVREVSNNPGKIDLKVLNFQLQHIISTSTRKIDNVELPATDCSGISGSYMYMATGNIGYRLAARMSLEVPQDQNLNGSYWFRCSFPVEQLQVKRVDMEALNMAVNYWWSVDMRNPLYKTYLTTCGYESAIVASAVQLKSATDLTIEVVWVENERAKELHDGCKILGDQGIMRTDTVKSVTIPKNTTIAIQYITFNVRDGGAIQLVQSDLRGSVVLNSNAFGDQQAAGAATNDSDSDEGYPVTVVKSKGGHSYEFDEETLKKILERPEARDLPVAVISVAGPSRGGKSFLLNFFKSYLSGKDESDWLMNPTSRREGKNFFEWKEGDDPHTKGITMWSRPFVVQRSNGEKVALLLMDTQGSFDYSSTMTSNAAIFALSTLLSSLQIFNITRRIGKDTLTNLHFFGEYGKLTAQENTSKPFQSLLFLIRDYPYSSTHKIKKTSFGYEGGKSHLEKHLPKLSSPERSDNDPEWDHCVEVHEFTNVDQFGTPYLQRGKQVKHVKSDPEPDISDMFESVECFLLPRPGNHISDGFPFDFNDPKITDENNDFLHYVQDLVYDICAPHAVSLKQHNGHIMDTNSFLITFKKLAAVYSSGRLPEVGSVFSVSANTQHAIAKMESVQSYYLYMQRFILEKQMKGFMEHEEEFDQSSARWRNNALDKFMTTPKMGFEKYGSNYLRELEMEIETHYKEGKEELSGIPLFVDAKSNNEKQLAECTADFERQATMFFDKHKHRPTMELGEATRYYNIIKHEMVDRFMQTLTGGDVLVTPYAEKLRKVMDDICSHMQDVLLKKPTKAEAIMTQERAAGATLTHHSERLSQLMKDHVTDKASIHKDEVRTKLSEIREQTIQYFADQPKEGGKKMSDETLVRVLELVDRKQQEIDVILDSKVDEVAAEASNLNAYNQALDFYIAQMNEFVIDRMNAETVDHSDIEETQTRLKYECLKMYTGTGQPIGGPRKKYMDLLEVAAQKEYERVKGKLRHKPSKAELIETNTSVVDGIYDTFEKTMDKCLVQFVYYGLYREEDKKSSLEEAKKIALDEYSKATKKGGEKSIAQYKEILELKIKEYVGKFNENIREIPTPDVAEKKNEELVDRLVLRYTKKMRAVAEDKYKNHYHRWYSTWFNKNHPGIREEICNEFEREVIGDYVFKNRFRARLESNITDTYKKFMKKDDKWFKENDDNKRKALFQ